MPSDTNSKAQQVQVEVLRRLGPARRFAMAMQMSSDVRRISVEAERRRHPEYSAAEAVQAVARRTWGTDLAKRVDAANR